MHKTLLKLLSGVCLFAALAPLAANAEEKTLVVYTYESFTSDWGPGPKVEEAFEAKCGCDLIFRPAADGVALLNKLRLEGENSEADVVLGLDTNLTAEAAASGLFVPHGVDTSATLIPGGWADAMFVPFDYGYFAVIYDTQKVEKAPASMEEFLADAEGGKIAIQDPRTSTPGLGLMLWLKTLYGEDAGAAYEKLQKRVLTITPGWSEAYGLFTNGEAPYVLSYTTSPAYHMIAEETERYQAAAFSEGHYMQIEVAGQTAKGAANPLSAQFLAFLLSPEFQDIIPETNWMMPAAAGSAPLNEAFGKLVQPTESLLLDSDEVAQNRSAWVDEWLAVMSK